MTWTIDIKSMLLGGGLALVMLMGAGAGNAGPPTSEPRFEMVRASDDDVFLVDRNSGRVLLRTQDPPSPDWPDRWHDVTPKMLK